MTIVSVVELVANDLHILGSCAAPVVSHYEFLHVVLNSFRSLYGIRNDNGITNNL